ncbi:MAG: cache domain-containing protein [Spirochaetales bacterium]|nr:cache domain-containing protein [Spirochaetales bacterium]
MDLEQHSAHTKNALGTAAEDIHKWIDGYFDSESFRDFMADGKLPGAYDPYSHRRFRHCREALNDAVAAFRSVYPEETIKKVFYMHIRDDYQGYLPFRRDFDDPEFIRKYHKPPEEPPDRILSREELEKYFKNRRYSLSEKEKKRNGRFILRIVIPALAAAFLFVLFIFAFIIPDIRDVMMDGKKEMIRELAKAGASVIGYYVKKSENGRMDRAEAMEQAKRELEKMRYGIQSKDYYWITDMHPYMLMHPYRKELVGTDLSNYRDHEDKSGKYLFREAVEIAQRDGEGFIEYYWQWMDDPQKSALKLSFVTRIPDWDWILGTGIYINDVEEEMRGISETFSWTALVLVIIICAALVFVVLQSMSIEKRRRNAETGLEEARDRYRSLAEAANEGYILVINNGIVYTNRKIRNLLGYSDDEFRKCETGDLFAKDREAEFYHPENLYAMSEKGPSDSWLSVTLLGKDGNKAETQLKVSRVFFSDKDAYLLTVRTAHEFQENMLVDGLAGGSTDIITVNERIRKSRNTAGCLFALDALPRAVESLAGPAEKRKWIGSAYKTLCTRLIELVLRENTGRDFLKTDPPEFCFLHLGSNARNEMTFFSDQDNAFVFDQPDSLQGTVALSRYFLDLNRKVCAFLKKAGFNYCPGGIQASNPAWCMTKDQWFRKIDGWFEKYSGGTMTEIHVFADLDTEAGPLAAELRERFFAGIRRHPEFIKAAILIMTQ